MGKTLSLLLALLLSHGLSLFSQHKITGVVTGGEDEPLQYVTVSLLGLDSSFVKGCMTDTLGVYRMDGVVAGDYVLTFDMLGYEPERAPVYISGDVKMDVRSNPASE